MEQHRTITRLLQALSEEKTPGFWKERTDIEFDLQQATNGRFVYVRDIAIGGMGRVMLAYDTALQRNVAVKLLQMPGDSSPEDTDAARFLREARITAGLVHPSIVPVYDLGLTESGDRYFIMQVIEGVTLREVFDRAMESSTERMECVSHFLGTLCRVCQAIGYAHHKGVLHLDLKPSNIMEGAFGEVIVLDWGVARTMVEIKESCRNDSQESMGGAGKRTIAGTPGYMAPEQYIGDASLLSPATDVYALGVILYEILTTQLPFYGEAFHEVRQSAVSGRLRPIQECARENGQRRIPKPLVAVCGKALSLNPRQRYHNAQQLAEDLQAYLEHRAVSAFREDPIRRFRRCIQRYKVATAIVTSVFTMVTVMLAAYFTYSTSKQRYINVLDAQVTARREEYQDALRELGWSERLLANSQEETSEKRALLETGVDTARRHVGLTMQQLRLALTALVAVEQKRAAPILNRELRRLWLREMQAAMQRGDRSHVSRSFRQMSEEQGSVSWWRWEPDEFDDVERIREWLKEQEN